MIGRYFSPKGPVIFLFAMVVLAALIALDKGVGPISAAWPFVMLCLLFVAALTISRRMWSARKDFEAVRRIEGESLYGILPKRLREWLFP